MIVIIAITIIGMTVRIMLTGVTWWSTIESTVLTTTSEPGISGTTGSGATSIRIAKRDAMTDAKRDRRREFVMARETRAGRVSRS
jgi:hypothetical protein